MGLSYATLPGPHGAKKQIKQNVEPRGLQEAENYAAAYEKKRQNVETRNQYANSIHIYTGCTAAIAPQ